MVENAKENGPVASEDLYSNNISEALLKHNEQQHEEPKIYENKHQIVPERSGLEVKQTSLVGPPPPV